MVWEACQEWVECHQVYNYFKVKFIFKNVLNLGMDMSALGGMMGDKPGMDDLEGDSDDEDLPDLE